MVTLGPVEIVADTVVLVAFGEDVLAWTVDGTLHLHAVVWFFVVVLLLSLADGARGRR